jgi:hypothetical protein
VRTPHHADHIPPPRSLAGAGVTAYAARASGVRHCPVLGCHDDTGQPRPLTDQPLCHQCADKVTRVLNSLPALYGALRSRVRPATGHPEPLSGTRTPQTPLDLTATALATRITDTLHDYARTALVLIGETPRGELPVREQWSIDQSMATLGGHAHTLYTHPYYGPAYADDVLRLAHRAWHVAGWGTGRHNLTHPCPQCGLLTLTRYHSYVDFVTCRWCRLVWDESTYADMAAAWIREQKPGVR